MDNVYLKFLKTELDKKELDLEMKDIELDSQKKKVERLLLKVFDLNEKLKNTPENDLNMKLELQDKINLEQNYKLQEQNVIISKFKNEIKSLKQTHERMEERLKQDHGKKLELQEKTILEQNAKLQQRENSISKMEDEIKNLKQQLEISEEKLCKDHIKMEQLHVALENQKTELETQKLQIVDLKKENNQLNQKLNFVNSDRIEKDNIKEEKTILQQFEVQISGNRNLELEDNQSNILQSNESNNYKGIFSTFEERDVKPITVADFANIILTVDEIQANHSRSKNSNDQFLLGKCPITSLSMIKSELSDLSETNVNETQQENNVGKNNCNNSIKIEQFQNTIPESKKVSHSSDEYTENIDEIKNEMQFTKDTEIEQIHSSVTNQISNNENIHTDNKLKINAVHTKIKCPICSKELSQIGNLNEHVANVHQKLTLFKCQMCSNAFAQKNTLKRHVNTVHLNLTLYKCQICCNAFGERGSLTRHVNTVHNELKPN